ncbi:MAG: phospho-N-acetylmuramoyl-pentapeptide-transferase [Spirochaetales bacterium]|nr:phospho-N-acetylmuramoyl-pentapeptide-transferase [Spirochaetales bacterium]MCF7937631.1 phospho-N-acetylmuramoyl-pentapeptide-transferase [Spirochaetales bacterium]
MFPELLYPLVEYVSVFNIFQYITFRSAYAAVTALLISFLLGPRLISYLKAKKAGEEIRKDGPERHRTKSGTPTMGGVLIIISIVISVLLWQDLRSPYTWITLTAVIGFGAIGFVDDFLKTFKDGSEGMSAKVKLLAQGLVSATIAVWFYSLGYQEATLLYIPFVKEPILDLSVLYIPFAVIFLTGLSNAVNLTDGLDGLAIGLVIMVTIAMAILSYLTGRVDYAEYLQIPFMAGSGELTVFALATLGAAVGFLWFNAHPAEIMMGDTGSLALGGLLGTLALLTKKEVLLIIVGGVFVLEAFSVIIQVLVYRRTGRRVFLMAPLHHHFELKGWEETKVVMRFWIIGGLFAILSLSTLKLQ